MPILLSSVRRGRRVWRRSTALLGAALLMGLALVAGAGCDGGDPPPTVQTDMVEPGFDQTLVFVDASASAKASDRTVRTFHDELARVVETSLDEPGDRLSIFPVHAHTISKVGQWDVANEVELPPWKEFESERKQAKGYYFGRIQQFKQQAAEQAQAQVARLRGDRSYRNWTDLWGTLEVASDEIDTTAAHVELIYFSDMFESVQGEGRHDFDRRPPATRQQAAAWARADAERLADFVTVDREALAAAHVRVVLGDMGAKAGGQYVKHYWERLFAALGVQEVTYN